MNPLERVEELIQQLDGAADPNIRSAARDFVQALMDFHGAAVARMLELVDSPTLGSFGRDETVAPLLLLYDLHPDTTETRVRRAIDPLRNVELIVVDDLEVKVRVNGRSHSGREMIEKTILSAAPEVSAIHIEGLKTPDFVPLESLIAV
jgi:hypothetical protein